MRDGLLVINKPRGITSTRVVEKVKKKLKAKVGHTGTLDPLATGVLVLLVGKATRFSWLFVEMDKTYRVTALLGFSTDTYDVEGKILKTAEVSVDCGEVKRALEDFRGEIEQLPPPFSAKKVEGKRAYRLARKGIQPQLKPVKVKVYELSMERCEPPELELKMVVSSGTYVRTLIHDLGQRLGVGAVVKELVRESVGPFSLQESVGLEEFLSSSDPWSYVLSMEEAFYFLPKISLDFFTGKRILNGNPVLIKNKVQDGYVTIYIDSLFVGIGSVKSAILKPERLVLPEGSQT
ncbi:tRNA pseudouridine55 synthase [Hydrogenivirga caldilitoris]|uniref:tRNA pseudouridine synthase B n=1 Tax=Hydrogenivirga caldilitoris TaxID=246264 RepID=A0A497XPU8_9AQUI|nr:tRNA pseudouridine(55) synthase TruB [Hydrogenivirga caldilitoris]RLJ70997.1 tRNA pseudouridine55 synthase [Hydrogenivirga caldilitoris]